MQLRIPRQPDPRAGVLMMTRQEHQHDHPRSRPGQAQKPPRHVPRLTFARTTIKSQNCVPYHNATPKAMRHNCNCLPLVYKRRRHPPNRGGRTHAQPLTHPPSLTILALASITSQGLGGFSSSPTSLVTPLYEHHGALQYSATSAHLLDVWPTVGTRINIMSHCCFAPAIERPISAHLLVSVRTTFRTEKCPHPCRLQRHLHREQ
jgi:hypothetical protein